MNPLLQDIFAEAQKIVDLATTKQWRIATAESYTGGLIGGAITAIPGSSTPFKGGIIAYDNAIKTKLLGVSPSVLGKYGAVSEKTAERMAAGARERLDVDLAVSVTGIAGPGGAVEGKPIGTVWIGIATKDAVSATVFNFGDIGRNAVRDQTVLEALRMLTGALEG
ncbi:CinA family protein [Litorimonas sp. RW-G-Af-16]|uniref:CinA family protein n=1 Tax=Litorimonas sp. RW-G-Af-16 TaxID=3241168 RepID=UPI003AAF70C6